MDIKNTRKGISSGFPSLDEITGGWQDSNLIVIASRPSIGKTAFAMQIACDAAVDNNIPVAFFSLEMSAGQFGGRIILHEIYNSQKLDSSEKHLARLSESPLYVDDTPGLKIDEFKTKAKELVEEKGVRLIIVDYLQLMCGPEELELKGQREEVINYIVKTLKSVAKELNVPIIALCQLSRTSSGRPELSQLRESGAIEEVADSIILIHRPYIISVPETPGDRELRILIVAKNRNGELGEVPARFHSDNLSFTESHDPVVIREPERDSSTIQINSRLNKQYTLNTFKIMPSNVEAIKVAMDFICNLKNSQQVLMIGPPGSGKTHLVNAMGNAIDSDARVIYVTGDEFKNQYMDAVKTNHLSDFRDFYAKVDVLILDNLEDLIGAGAQNAFLHIIDHLDQSGKRLVFASSRDLDDLENLFDVRIFTIIRGGRVVEIGKFQK